MEEDGRKENQEESESAFKMANKIANYEERRRRTRRKKNFSN